MGKNRILTIILFIILLNIEIIIIVNTKPGLIPKISQCHYITETIPYKYMIEKGISYQTTSKILTTTTFINYYEETIIKEKELETIPIAKTINNINKELESNNQKLSSSKIKELINNFTNKDQIKKINNYKKQNKLIKISKMTSKQNIKILTILLIIIVIIMYKTNNKKTYKELIKSIKLTTISLMIILIFFLFFQFFYQNNQNIVYNILRETLNSLFVPIIKTISINILIITIISKLGKVPRKKEKVWK